MYFFRSTSPTTSKTSGEQKDAKASSRDRDEGTSQPSPRWEEVETVRRHYLASGCSGGVEVVDAICLWIVFVASTTYCPVCVFVSWLDVYVQISWWLLTYLDAHPFYLFQWLIVDVSTCFSISLGPLLLSITPPPCHWVVQIPGREKCSKWKYKDDEGGKKDAEKEKTRSREQESSMHQIINEWRFQNYHYIPLLMQLCSFFFILWLVTALLFQEH